MKYLKHVALAILFGAIFTVSAFADGKPHNGGPGNGGPGKGMHYGLSDSCWSVFLSQISAADAAKIAADQQTISDDQKQIDAINQQVGVLLKSSLGKKDSATMAQIKALQMQIGPLQQAIVAAQMDIDVIVKANGSLFQTVSENCGRPDKGGRDTTGKDTTKGGPGHGNPPPGKGTRGHFGLSDSCWNIFLSQLTAADQAQLAADQKIITDNQTQIDALIKQIRALKGNARDSATRAQIKSLMDQINAILKSSLAAEKDYNSIIRKYEAILQGIRKDCGRTAIHKGNPGDPTNDGFKVSAVVPNPASIGGTASITITMIADAPVTITLSDAMMFGKVTPQVIFNGTLTAGDHIQTIDLAGLKAGIYLITVQSGNEQQMQKLVIQ